MLVRVVNYSMMILVVGSLMVFFGLDYKDAIQLGVLMVVLKVLEEYKFRHLRRMIETQDRIIKKYEQNAKKN